MPLIRKRRTRDAEEEPETSESEEPQARDPQRRRRTNDAPQATQQQHTGDDAGYGSDAGNDTTGGVVPAARKLCRYALSCEYSRQRITRTDIGTKVLPSNSGRMFKAVFAEAQNMLRETFGMEMVELPKADKVTVQQKRAAQKQVTQSASTGAWVLASTLPPKYRAPTVIPPPAVPTQEQEASYIAIYTFIVTSIYLHGGDLEESKLERYLRRMNLERNTPMGPVEDLVKRLIKEQYIARYTDKSGQDEVHHYIVGPRGKIEVGEEGASGLVRTVYGGSVDDLEQRIDRSLGISSKADAAEKRRKDEEEAQDINGLKAQRGKSQRRSTQRPNGESEEEEQSDDDDDDDD